MQKRAKITAMTMVMCLALLVGACSNPVQTNNNAAPPITNSAGASAEQTKAAQQTETQAKTRIVSTVKGDV